MSGDRPPMVKFPVCRMWARVGPTGIPYWSGRWGGARVLLVPNNDPADDDDATHLLVLGEAEPQTRKPRREQ